MQVVHFTNESVGSIDWELPTTVANRISALSPEMQKAVLSELESHMKATTQILVATLHLGAHAEQAFDMIRENGAALARRLGQYTESLM